LRNEKHALPHHTKTVPKRRGGRPDPQQREQRTSGRSRATYQAGFRQAGTKCGGGVTARNGIQALAVGSRAGGRPRTTPFVQTRERLRPLNPEQLRGVQRRGGSAHRQREGGEKHPLACNAMRRNTPVEKTQPLQKIMAPTKEISEKDATIGGKGEGQKLELKQHGSDPTPLFHMVRTLRLGKKWGVSTPKKDKKRKKQGKGGKRQDQNSEKTPLIVVRTGSRKKAWNLPGDKKRGRGGGHQYRTT